MSSALKNLYEKNLSSFPRYMKNLNIDDKSLTSLMSSYVINSERERRLGNTPTPFNHTL